MPETAESCEPRRRATSSASSAMPGARPMRCTCSAWPRPSARTGLARSRFFEASLDAFRRLGDDHYVLLASGRHRVDRAELGDRERGKRLHEETLARARASGDNGVVALQLWQLAGLANKEGRTSEALSMLREALVLNRD